MALDPLSDEQIVQLVNTCHSIATAHLNITQRIDDLTKQVYQVEHHQGLMARAQTSFLTIFEKIEQQQEKLIEAQEILTSNQSNLANAVKQLADSQLQLTRFVERLDDKLSSTSAAMERLDRIIDYLMRQNNTKSDSNETQDS
jgi:methyl-accepting chemotaxis protein